MRFSKEPRRRMMDNLPPNDIYFFWLEKLDIINIEPVIFSDLFLDNLVCLFYAGIADMT